MLPSISVRRVSIQLPSEPALANVLLVTDDDDLRAAAGRALEAAGYAVFAAAHSGHAMLVALEGVQIDVAVVELAMPEMSGPALTTKLRRLRPDLQALYLGKNGTPECEEVLVRPFTRDHLLSRLARVLSTSAVPAS
jgi:CheY-like chemotaxis protein